MQLPAARAVRIGLGLFVIGLGFVVGDVLAFFLGTRDTPLGLNLACLLAPAGFLIATWSALRTGRAEQRAAAREVSDS